MICLCDGSEVQRTCGRQHLYATCGLATCMLRLLMNANAAGYAAASAVVVEVEVSQVPNVSLAASCRLVGVASTQQRDLTPT